MKKHQFITVLAAMLLIFSSCRDENLAPIATFEQSEKGAYVRVVSQSNENVNLFDLENSGIIYSVEFVDLEKVNLVSEYNLQLTFEDNSPQNGDISVGPVDFRSWSSSEFVTNKTGFKGLENITITPTEALIALGINVEEVRSGDNFKFLGRVTTTGGATFSQSNSSAAVNGASFRGFFNYRLTAFCPSNLEGTYSYITSASSVVCSKETEINNDLTGTVSVIALGDGTYNFSDWSFGTYGVCNETNKIADSGSLIFTETCREIAFTGKVDDFGDKWSFESTVESKEWAISWENTFGEKGATVLLNDNGWDFTIEQ